MLFPCRHCQGSGKVDLPPALRETHEIISRLGRATIPQVWKKFKRTTTQSGANRRVSRLLKMGLVKPVASTDLVTRYSVV